MKINEWTLKNYKSFGNTLTKIEINNNKGELILLTGGNGKGKSSLISSLDVAMFGQELNKRGTKLAKSNFPNRTNQNMEVTVKFNNGENDIHIIRKMKSVSSSLSTELYIDNIPYNKTKIDETILQKIGFDYNTYKTFISLNVNIFKNFISLTPEDKRLLLDKLFNLEQINDLNKLLKQLQTSNEKTYNTLQREIDIYSNNIDELTDTINEFKNKVKFNKEEKISELKQLLKDKKQLFVDIESQKDDIEETINVLREGISKLNLKIRDINKDISYTNEKIDLFNLGKCPTCHTELIGELNLLPEYEEKLNKLNEVKSKTQNKIDNATIELNNQNNDFKGINHKHNMILQEVHIIKSEMSKLKDEEEIDLDSFYKNIQINKTKKEDKEKEYIEIQKLKTVYNILLPILSESGIKRDIIDSIIDPINEFIKEDLTYLKLPYTVELNNNFDAHIYEFNKEIDSETLSSGEAKKINIIIMLAYIKMLRMKRDINILFLDEVFTTIDIESIDDILMLFKNFVKDRNVNVFLVHHSQLKEWFFDRIINVKKSTFSYIEE
jgi:DNA repair exonuclease SbcCD ATPase subunit